MGSNEAVCTALKNKAALLLNSQNAYLKALAPEAELEFQRRKQMGEKNRQKDRVHYELAFGIVGKGALSTTVSGKSILDNETILHICETTAILRNAKLEDGITPKYPNLAILEPIKEDDLKNEYRDSEDIYKFGLKLGYIRTKQSAVPVGEDKYFRNSKGEICVYRQGVIKALDEEIKTKTRPGLSYFLSKKDIETCLDAEKSGYLGVYSIYFPYVHDQTQTCYLRATFRVSYPLDKGKASLIRCKLNIPDINVVHDTDTWKDGVKRYQYRGRFMPIDGAHHFFAYLDLDLDYIDGREQGDENQINADIFTLIFTELSRSQTYTTGVLSSLNQRIKDEKHVPSERRTYSAKTVISRQKFDGNILEKDEAEFNFMRTKPKYFKTLEDLKTESSEGKYVAEHFFEPILTEPGNGILQATPIVEEI